MTKQQRIAKFKNSRAYGKTIGEKKAMGYTKESNGWQTKVSYRSTESFRDRNNWRADVYHNGIYFCHDIFETIEEAEYYANGMLK